MKVVGDLLRLNAKRYPLKKAVVIEDEFVTYGQLNDKVNQLAHGLVAIGVKAKDRVAVMGQNSVEWLMIAYACAKCGATLVPMNWRNKKDEVAYVVNNSESVSLFFGPEFRSLVGEASKEFVRPVHLIAISCGALEQGLTMDQLVANPPDEPSIEIDPKWPFLLLYTSGTTGVPKGVLISHSASLNLYVGLALEGNVREDEIALAAMPFFHAGMQAVVQPTFLRGGTVVIMAAHFDPDKVLNTIARHKVTMTSWVPTQLAMLTGHPAISKYDVSSLKKIWYGSSPIRSALLADTMRSFNADLYQLYGQTETNIVSMLRPEDHHGKRAQFTGRELFNADLRVVDEEGNDVKVGEVGEIVSRQDGLGMIGYWKAEEANRATIKNGWIYTGDLGRVEGDGYFTVVDRSKDMIISGAENIYPKEIEDVIHQHPAVCEVAVFGIPDETWGESVCAAVVAKEGYRLDETEIINYCADKLAGYKKPKRVVFVSDLPKNAIGKVTKNVLRAPFWADRTKKI
jgi:fatty-acyl-CoA synthase